MNNNTSFVLEITKGCGMKCTGCRVNKEVGSAPHGVGIPMDLVYLAADFVANGADMQEIEIGPTDLMTAVNRTAIFESDAVRDMCRWFKVVVATASMLTPNTDDVIEFARQMSSLTDEYVGLVIPIELRHVYNRKYIERIHSNVNLFKDHLSCGFSEVIFNIIFNDEAIASIKGIHELTDLFSRARDLKMDENSAIDFAFHHGRSFGILDNAREFISNTKTMYDLIIADLSKRRSIHREHIPAPALMESENMEVLYNSTGLFVRPILNERIFIEGEDYKITCEWTYENIKEFMDRRLEKNFELSKSLECSNCKYLNRCANRDVQILMNTLGTTRCVSILPMLEKESNSDPNQPK